MLKNPRILLAIGPFEFVGTLERETAPVSVAWLLQQLPLKGLLRHARWSGEAAWLPLEGSPQLPAENATAHPRPGQILLYAGSLSQAELLIPYGACAFASKAGTLAGSPVMSLDGPLEDLCALGRLLIEEGMKPLRLQTFSD